MRVLVLYDSLGGNTEKVAKRIHKVIVQANIDTTLLKIDSLTEVDFNSFDLILCGSPVIEWLPSKKMMDFLKKKLKEHRTLDLLPCAPVKKDKFAVCFGTLCGAHIGRHEGYAMVDWLSSFFEHIGFFVLEKILIPGEIRRSDMDSASLSDLNRLGMFGNIIGRPSESDLTNVEVQIIGLLRHIRYTL